MRVGRINFGKVGEKIGEAVEAVHDKAEDLGGRAKELLDLQAENRKLRAALEFYADPATYAGVKFPPDTYELKDGLAYDHGDLVITDENGRATYASGKLARETLGIDP